MSVRSQRAGAGPGGNVGFTRVRWLVPTELSSQSELGSGRPDSSRTSKAGAPGGRLRCGHCIRRAWSSLIVATPGPLPPPPEDISRLNLPLIELHRHWFRSHAIDKSPVYYGRNARYRFDDPA